MNLILIKIQTSEKKEEINLPILKRRMASGSKGLYGMACFLDSVEIFEYFLEWNFGLKIALSNGRIFCKTKALLKSTTATGSKSRKTCTKHFASQLVIFRCNPDHPWRLRSFCSKPDWTLPTILLDIEGLLTITTLRIVSWIVRWVTQANHNQEFSSGVWFRLKATDVR